MHLGRCLTARVREGLRSGGTDMQAVLPSPNWFLLPCVFQEASPHWGQSGSETGTLSSEGGVCRLGTVPILVGVQMALKHLRA